ncbi:hypothetical protein NHX12_010189 [Muraenolepis orangiensis]|uniref:VPS37 C-terminal domain-containing protein n=1 Tax=Muraenolepis orangiensis TaxID=630683 RepID=A0A9Q0I868_9TELE|nr:hypothetical protein NHX12_010189 [Muraenolepis orangiensis]
MSDLKEANSCPPPDGYRALSTGELRELLQNEDKMDQIIHHNEKFQELQLQRESLLASNRGLAEDSLARRPPLDDGKLRLAEKYRQLSGLTAACSEKRRQLENHGSRGSPLTAQTLLREEVARAEERSEELLERFMEGSVNLESFLESFQSSRKTYHVRRAQVEKVQELCRAKTVKPAPEPQKAVPEVRKDPETAPEALALALARPNGFVAQGPMRVFQLRYGLTPAILLPRCPVSPRSAQALSPQGGAPPPMPPEPQHPSSGQTHLLAHGGHGHPVGLRVIGQLAGGWPPVGGRPVRVQQLYRPGPHQTETPYR